MRMQEVIPLLEFVCPSDDDLAVQWPLLLRVLNRRNDLGTEPVTWATVAATGSRDAIKRLV